VADRRRLTFLAVLAALLAALLLFGHHQVEPPPRSRAPARIAKPQRAFDPAPTGLSRAAHRFLGAFLAHEVGGAGPRTVAVLRHRSTVTFARRLLAAPRPRRSLPRRATVTLLRTRLLPGHPDLALVSGTARRPAGPEPFAFLFANRRGRWLALAPAE
jgi:hypothetical protein